jgi:hypothetical protein
MPDTPLQGYSFSTNLFVSRKASGDGIIVGGTTVDASRWTRVLSQRAAQMLWFHLTRFLFPEKSDMVSALVTTAPLRSSDMPTITTHMTVDQLDSGGYEVVGWIGDQNWGVRIGAPDARQFWMALDIALYPAGWQGSGPGGRPLK